MTSPQLLTAFEHCTRKGFWSLDWERAKIDLHELLMAGITEGLTTTRQDIGEAAGEKIMEISAVKNIVSDQHDLYSQVVHHCAIADIVATAVRKPQEAPWTFPDPETLPNGVLWHSGCFLAPSGTSLRRIVLATNWSDDRHFSEAQSWHSLAESCVYGLPLQEAVIVLGASRDGRRHGYWSKGLRHPVNKKLRFRKKTDRANGFKDSWSVIFREDYDEISTREWLDAMYSDGVLQDVCFSVEIPLPEKAARQKVIDLAAKKLDILYSTKELPEPNLSTCFWPSRCHFINCCSKGESEPNGKYGFVRIT